MKQAGHRRTGTARLHTREALAGVGATVTEAGGGGAALGEGSECQGRWNVLQTGWRRLQDPASVLSAAESRRPTRRARVVDFITARSRARDCERGVRAS